MRRAAATQLRQAQPAAASRLTAAAVAVDVAGADGSAQIGLLRFDDLQQRIPREEVSAAAVAAAAVAAVNKAPQVAEFERLVGGMVRVGVGVAGRAQRCWRIRRDE